MAKGVAASFKAWRRAARERRLAKRLLPLNPPAIESRAPAINAPPAAPAPLVRGDVRIPAPAPLNILTVGVYLADRPNTAAHVIAELANSGPHRVTQRWIGLTLSEGGAAPVLPFTQRMQAGRAPRSALLNELIGDDLAAFDWVMVCDDDVELPSGFVEDFFGAAAHCDFSLCQPGRTADSYIDAPIMQQAPGLIARRTRFVEIGPIACIRRDAFSLLLPFDEKAQMGWGQDFVWAARLEHAGLKLGVVDATPIAHRIRPTVANYSGREAAAAMAALLAREPHLTRDEAFTVLEAYAEA